MNRGENNDKKKEKQISPESEESETEYYDPSQKYEKEKANSKKSFLHKKRYILAKEKKKKPHLKEELDKFSERKKYIKYEKKNSEKEFSEALKKDLENKIQNLANQLEQQKKELENQRIESYISNEKLIQQLENQRIESYISNEKLTQQLEKQSLESYISKEKLTQQLEKQRTESDAFLQKLNEDNYRLKLSIKERIAFEDKMFQKIDKLQNQVKELEQFHFQVKLRKLTKNLIEFLFRQYYPVFMRSNKITKKN